MKTRAALGVLLAFAGCTENNLAYCPPTFNCRPADLAPHVDARDADIDANDEGDMSNFADMQQTKDAMAPADIAIPDDLATVEDMVPADATRPPDTMLPLDMSMPSETCTNILDADPMAKDGSYTLYVSRNLNKPWTAYCLDMKSGNPKEYLALAMIGLNDNFSQYTAGGASPGTSVRTNFSRIRIDPKTLLVDVSDQTFSTSSGQLTNSGGPVVTSMSYAAAMDCAPQGWGIPTGLGNVDLRGTPFGVRPGIFGQGPPASGKWCGGVSYSNGNQTVDIKGGGWCGWWAAGPASYGQFGSPFNGAGSFQMQLDYL